MMLLYTEESVDMELARVHYINEKYRTPELTEVDLS